MKRTQLDQIFERSMSDVSHKPQHPMSEAQIAAAAESTSGVGIWLLAHAREILLCAVSLAVGIGGTLLFIHLTGNRNTVPAETAAAIATDTTSTTGTTMVAEDTVTYTGETTVNEVETRRDVSLQTDPNTAPVETLRTTSLQNDRHTPSVTEPIVVKKTVVQRDTVVINETVTLKDTVYVQ